MIFIVAFIAIVMYALAVLSLSYKNWVAFIFYGPLSIVFGGPLVVRLWQWVLA